MSESLLDLNTLISAVSGSQISSAKLCLFTSVTTDSRAVKEKAMFVPLIGEFQDGHKYVGQAIEKGASVILINRSEYKKNPSLYDAYCVEGGQSSPVIIAVDNTLYALQAAAKAYARLKASNMIRISITGSSGKTTTKEMMVSVCKAYFGEDKVAYTKGNFNSETGLPLSIFQIKGDEKCGVFEMGMNRENEIGEISAVWQSQYGIITNIGNAHIGILGSRENIAREKRKSFDYIPETGAAFVPADDDFAEFCCQKVKGKLVKFGKSIPSSVSGVQFIEDMGLFGSRFSLDGLEIKLPLPGQYNYQNALSVIALAKEIGIPAEAIKEGLEKTSALSGRMELKKTLLKSGKKAVILCDCYNANPDSMQKVIDFCSEVKEQKEKLFVLGDMKELGSESAEAHLALAKKVAEVKPALVILAGSEMQVAAKYLEDKQLFPLLYFKNNDAAFFEEASKKILAFAQDNSLLLIKGSHSMALEKIIPLIEKDQKEGQD